MSASTGLLPDRWTSGPGVVDVAGTNKATRVRWSTSQENAEMQRLVERVGAGHGVYLYTPCYRVRYATTAAGGTRGREQPGRRVLSVAARMSAREAWFTVKNHWQNDKRQTILIQNVQRAWRRPATLAEEAGETKKAILSILALADTYLRDRHAKARRLAAPACATVPYRSGSHESFVEYDVVSYHTGLDDNEDFVVFQPIEATV